MSRSARAPFQEESDDDGIRTDSTEASEERDQYNVEAIRAERNNPETGLEYLVDWEGYPLSRATWEPASNILSDVVLRDWRRAKKAVQDGRRLPFDVEQWSEAVEDYEAEADRRRALRRKKRIKRGITVSPHSSDEDSAPPLVSPRKRVRQATVLRKGVAQPVKKKRRTDSKADQSENDESEYIVTDGEASDANSLFIDSEGEVQEETAPSPPRQDARSSKAAQELRRHVPQPVTRKEPLVAKSPPKEAPQTQTTSAARKSAPSLPSASSVLPSAKPTKDVMANWNATSKRKERPRVSGETPKNSMDEKFRNLSQLNRHQLYGRNERAPDINALTVIDPRTGKAIPPKLPAHAPSDATIPTPTDAERSPTPTTTHVITAGDGPPPPGQQSSPSDLQAAPNAASLPPHPSQSVVSGSNPSNAQGINQNFQGLPPTLSPGHPPPKSTSAEVQPSSQQQKATGSSNVHSVYRRRTPPPESKQHDTSPPAHSSAVEKAAEVQSSTDVSNSDHPPLPPPQFGRTTTCRYWEQGKCRFTAETCRHLHAYATENKKITCFYWHTSGTCKLSDEQCKYAHHYTGTVANPPPGYVLSHEIRRGSQNISIPDRRESTTSSGTGRATSPGFGAPKQARPPSIPMLKRQQTCHFWRNGRCEKTAGECEFAHYDTGVVAGPPGSFRKGSMTSANAVPVRAGRDIYQEPLVEFKSAHGAWSSIENEVQPRRDNRRPSDHSVQYPVKAHVNADRGKESFGLRDSSFCQVEADLLCSHDGTDERIPIKLEVTDRSALARLTGSTLALAIRVTHSVIANDFQQILWNEPARAQDSTAGGVTAAANHSTLHKLVELSKLHAAGLIATVEGQSCAAILYPNNAEEWKFLDTPSIVSTAPLRFRLFETLPGLAKTNPHANSDHEMQPTTVNIGEALAGLDSEQLMPAKELEQLQQQATPDRGVERPVFLMFPAAHYDELTVYIKYFQSLGGKVYTSQTEGAWSYFRTRCYAGGLIVMHPETPLWRIPGLFDLIMCKGGRVRIFSIGVDWTSALLEGREARFSCQRLFPLGSATFITDDLFVHHPEKALEVMQSFWYVNKAKPEGARFERLVARPGLKHWLQKLALEKAATEDEQSHRWMKLYEQVLLICPADAEDDESPANPLPNSHLVSISPDLLPSFDGLWERNEAAATEMMVEWFAGWSMINATQYRKFVVCHTSEKTTVDANGKGLIVQEPDPHEWATQYQHLGVLSPPEVVAMFTKEKK